MAELAGTENWTAEGIGEHFVDRVELKIDSPEKEQITQDYETTADPVVESKLVEQEDMVDSSSFQSGVYDISFENGNGNDGIFVDRSEIQLTLASPNTCQKFDVKQVDTNSSPDLFSESMTMQTTLSSPNGNSSLHAVDHLEKKSEGDELDTSEKVESRSVNSISLNGEMSLPVMENGCGSETDDLNIPQTETDYRVDHNLIPQVAAAEMSQRGCADLVTYECERRDKNIRYSDETPKEIEPLPQNSQEIEDTDYIEETLKMQEQPIEIKQERNIEVEKLYQHLQQQNIDQNVKELGEMSEGDFSQIEAAQDVTNKQDTATQDFEQKEEDINSQEIIQEQAKMLHIESESLPPLKMSSGKNPRVSTPPLQQIEIERKFKIPENSQEKLATLGAELIIEKSFKDVYYDNLNYSLTLQNYWFRNRDSVWELKVPVQPGEAFQLTSRYREITDAKEIIEYLSKVIQFKSTSEIRPMSDVLRDLRLVEFATITTTRQTYALPDCTIDLDLTDSGFRVGEIEVIVSSEERISEALRIIEDVAAKLGLCTNERTAGKLHTFLRQNSPDHFQKLMKANIF